MRSGGPSQGRMEWAVFDGGLRLNAEASERRSKLVHSQYAFCVLTRGSADWVYRNKSFAAQPGKVYVCEPGEVLNTYRTHGPGGYCVVFADAHWLAVIAESLGRDTNPHFPCEGLDDPRLWRLMVECSQIPGSRRDELSSRLSLLIGEVLRGEAPTRRPRVTAPSLVRAETLLRERYFSDPARTVRIREVAQQLQVSYHHLVHDFSKHYGAAPYEYVALLRRQYVFHLLRQGPSPQFHSLAVIRERAGYSDAAHMSRDLRKHFGHPPRQLARQLNQNWSRRRS